MKRKKISISIKSKQSQVIVNNSIDNVELKREIKKIREDFKKEITKKHTYNDTLYDHSFEIINKYKLPFDWIVYIMNWIDTGKKPKIKFNTEIKAELSSWKENGGFISSIPEFSYITITAPLYASPVEISEIFKKAQKKIISPIKSKTKIRKSKYSVVEEKINKMISDDETPTEIAKVMFFTDSPKLTEISKANDYKRNRRKRDRPFLKER